VWLTVQQGVPPATLAEWTLQGDGNRDFYDVSLVDGYNIPMRIDNTAGCPVYVASSRWFHFVKPPVQTRLPRRPRPELPVRTAGPVRLHRISAGMQVGVRSRPGPAEQPELLQRRLQYGGDLSFRKCSVLQLLQYVSSSVIFH
jgi:hypothetical protein